MTAPAAVLFDLYDTLVRSLLPAYQQQLSTRLGVSEETLLRAFTVTRPARWTGACESAEGDMAAVVRACGLDHGPEFVRELTAGHLDFLASGRSVEWYEDAQPVLAALRARGIKTAIVSNCDHWTYPVATAHDLGARVDAVVLSVDVGVTKPDPAIFRRALERLGVVAAEAVFVDDRPEYCAGAAALGLRARVIDRGASTEASRAGHPVIRSLKELL